MFFLIDKGNYIKQKEEALKTVPSKYTGSIQKQPKGSKPRWGEETKHFTFPYLEPSQSKKLIREEGLKTIDTLTQDQILHTKEYFSL